MSENLWGNALDEIDINEISTPLKILDEQAKHLTVSLKPKLIGKVINLSDSNVNRFGYSLEIIAPLINNYRHEILSISHDINMYPLQMSSDYLTTKQKQSDKSAPAYGLTITNEEELKLNLKEILTSDNLKKVIKNLLSLSTREKV